MKRLLMIALLAALALPVMVRAQDGEDPPAYAFDWPVAPATEEQIADLMACDIPGVSADHYPSVFSLTRLLDAYDPQTGCDWAALAYAHVTRLEQGDSMPDAAIDAFVNALAANPALAFSNSLFGNGFFGVTRLVAPPPLADQPVTAVTVDYHWDGSGDTVDYQIVIDKVDTAPVAVLSGESVPNVSAPVDAALAQALGAALTDLLPVDGAFSVVPCYDNFPDWTVTLTFADGAQLELVTAQSNFMAGGGPWHVAIDGQYYTQYGSAFLLAVADLARALELPLGQPEEWGCRWDWDLRQIVFPRAQ